MPYIIYITTNKTIGQKRLLGDGKLRRLILAAACLFPIGLFPLRNLPDVLPVDDFGVRKAIMQCYGLPAMPAKAEMVTIAYPWRPWRSIASWYLWRSLDNS